MKDALQLLQSQRRTPDCRRRQQPSPLGDIQPDYWLAEYTTELVNLLNVLAWLVDLESSQAERLEKISFGPAISRDELQAAGALDKPATLIPRQGAKDSSNQISFLDWETFCGLRLRKRPPLSFSLVIIS